MRICKWCRRPEVEHLDDRGCWVGDPYRMQGLYTGAGELFTFEADDSPVAKLLAAALSCAEAVREGEWLMVVWDLMADAIEDYWDEDLIAAEIEIKAEESE